MSSVADKSDSQHYQAMFEALVLQKGSIARAVEQALEAGTPAEQIRRQANGRFSLLVGDGARAEAASAQRAELILQRVGIEKSSTPFALIADRDAILRDEMAYLEQAHRPDAVQSPHILADLATRRAEMEALRADLISVACLHVEQSVLQQALAVISDKDPNFTRDVANVCAKAVSQAEVFSREAAQGASMRSILAAEILFERAGANSGAVEASPAAFTSAPASLRRH